MKPLLHFFENKVTLLLENKHIIKGLLKSIDYETKSITLIDVEDWGSEEGAHKTVPVNAKYNEKTFQITDLLSIQFENQHFKDQNKKYNKQDFFDNLESGFEKKSHNQRPKFKKYVEKERR